jgi:hypothetical protein
MFRTALIIAFWVVLAAGAGPVYRWVDEAGKVHYSDHPPPQDNESEELMPTLAPGSDDVGEAQETLDRLLPNQQASQDRRSAAREQGPAQSVLEQAQRGDRQERCLKFQDYLHTLELKVPGYVMNEKGDRVFLDAEERAAEIERSRAEINKFCD